MKSIVVAMPGVEALADSIAKARSFPTGKVALHVYPDGETGVTLTTDVKDASVIIVAALHRPNEQFLPLCFAVDLIRSMGAANVTLLAPYLPYMRQDKQFERGGAVTSRTFARLLSGLADRLVTVDPHLHRYRSLSDIYTIPTVVAHASTLVARWITKHVNKPVLIGPDDESKQWVASVAALTGTPYHVLAKTRLADDSVQITLPDLEQYDESNTPVLVDDIISTAGTMIATVTRLQKTRMSAPVCIGIHAVFADGAYEALTNAGVKAIVTTKTIEHVSNAIDITEVLLPLL